MWEPGLWYQPVTPQFGGYGDAIMTYICRSEIPSRIYAKHQYRQVKEYIGTWHGERDILMHVHYITAKYRSKNYNLYSKKVPTSWEEYSRACRKIQEKKELGLVGLRREISLIFGGGLRFNSNFRIWTCKFRGVRNSPISGQVNAKLRAEISTRVLINLNQKACTKSCVVSADK